MILSISVDQTAWLRRLVRAIAVHKPPKTGFLASSHISKQLLFYTYTCSRIILESIGTANLDFRYTIS